MRKPKNSDHNILEQVVRIFRLQMSMLFFEKEIHRKQLQAKSLPSIHHKLSLQYLYTPEFLGDQAMSIDHLSMFSSLPKIYKTSAQLSHVFLPIYRLRQVLNQRT